MSQPLIIVCDGDPTSPQTNSGVALNFINALKARTDVHVVAAVSSRPPDVITRITRLLSFHPKPDKWRFRSRRGGLERFARSATRDFRIRRLSPPEGVVIVHVRNFYAPAKLPYASFIDTTMLDDDRNWSSWEDSTPRRTPRAGFELERRFYAEALLVATASRAARASLQKDYGIAAARTGIVGGGTNVLDARPLRTQPIVAERAPDPSPIRILFIGRDFLRKGGDLLVEAAANLVREGLRIEVVIAGCTVQELPPFARSIGFVTDRTRVRDLYEETDIFCLPARWEPYGLVVQEAMSASVPVVVSDVGELPEIVVDDLTGLVVRSEDAGGLEIALRRLVLDPELRARFGSAGRARATSELGWAQVAQRFTSLLQRALDAETEHAGAPR